MESGRLSADVVRDGTYIGLRLHGDLDAYGAGVLQALLSEFEDVVHIDLTDVRSIDSSGLFALVTADTRARQRGHRLTLSPPPPLIHRIFAWTGLDARLQFVAA